MIEHTDFESWDVACEILARLGWVEVSRSGNRSRHPDRVSYFNKLVGGQGELEDFGDFYQFTGPDGGFKKALQKTLPDLPPNLRNAKL